MSVSVASVGECMLELSGRGRNWDMGFAGDTFNTLWAIRALLPRDSVTDYVSAFGDDPFSHEQRAFMEGYSIGTAQSPVIAGARPGLYAITLQGAERSFTYWRSDAAARLLASDPEKLGRSLANRSLVYFSGITLAILEPPARRFLFEALRQARSSDALIAFDPNYRPRLWASAETARAAIKEALDLADIALPTYPDEQMLFGDVSPNEAAKRLAGHGVEEIVVKNGSEPAWAAWKLETNAIPAINVTPVDTTGAGDSFNGAYLAARLLGAAPFEAAAKAHRVAAAVVQVRGALAPFEVLQAAFTD
ncbi:MAG TPA: sugar kinase [Rhizobiaceae bacterium]|nr:sugar kinase [Rhizobiaceae bacterium]